MKIISFSLWGDARLYNEGALQNIIDAKRFYPDWICRFYISEQFPPYIEATLRERGDCQIIRVSDGNGFFWRFAAASDDGVERVLFRDCDSRLNARELAAVEAWIESGSDFHVMRDADAHEEILMLSGMWGVKGNVIRNMNELVSTWLANNKHLADIKEADQLFLAEIIWPIAKDRGVIQHGRLGQPFPPHDPMHAGEYVGQVIQP